MNSMNSCSCCWHSFCLLLLLLIHFVGGGILCFSDSFHLLYPEDSSLLVKQTRAPLEQWSSAVPLLSTALNLAQWWVHVNITKMLRKKDIISCSIMVNSTCPDNRAWLILLKYFFCHTIYPVSKCETSLPSGLVYLLAFVHEIYLVYNADLCSCLEQKGFHCLNPPHP